MNKNNNNNNEAKQENEVEERKERIIIEEWCVLKMHYTHLFIGHVIVLITISNSISQMLQLEIE